ncbi:hypothetical protein Ddc_20679 [Ditylenchus destructor]|nr:hypothetical protein Ddc_20679 [Ditylenchus destructor]
MSGYNLRKRPAPVVTCQTTSAKVVKSRSKVHDNCNNYMLPDEILVLIFEKLPWKERLVIEEVCKKWQHVGKNLSWSHERIFDNESYVKLPELHVMHIKPLFERSGRNLRHLILRDWPSQVVLSFIRMAPNVQHLKLWAVNLTSERLRELAQIVPSLKSLDVINSVLINQYSFVQFPPNLKYLCLYDVKNADKILSWVAKGCKDLKGLRVFSTIGSINENALQAISQMKSLTSLAMQVGSTYNVGYVLEALTELRALEVNTVNKTVITAITQYCKNLEHLHISGNRGAEISPEEHASMLRLATLPNLCSLEIWASSYSKKQTTEFLNRFIANGNLQYIYTNSKVLLELEVLFEILRRCKSIRSIAFNFGRINAGVYSKICRVVDEIDERNRQHGEFLEETHPIVEVQCNKKLGRSITTPYKWLRFKDQVSPPAVLQKWQFGWLSAGKP